MTSTDQTAPTHHAVEVQTPRLGMADLLAFVLAWLPHLWLVRRFWFITDDAFITFRYSRNLALGNGPRFNLGDHTPVEGYSNFLWMCLGALFEKLQLDIELWPNLVSAACATVLLGSFYVVLRRRFLLGVPIACVSSLVFGLHVPFAVYATSGLAIMPYALCLFGGFERLILRREGVAPIAAGLWLLGASLLRVEGFYWALVLLILALVTRLAARERVLKQVLCAAAVLVVGYGSYWAWRYSYYGLPFPNTVYAKSGFTWQRLGRGVDYVMVQSLTQFVPFLALAGAFACLRKGRRSVGLGLFTMAAAFPIYSAVVSGDFMAMGRFLVPGWSFAALLIALGLHELAGSARALPRTALVALLGAGLAGIGLLPAFDRHVVPESVRARFHFRHNTEIYRSEFEQWTLQSWNAKRWAVMGRGLNKWTAPDATIALGGIGAVGYYSDRFIYDTNGLVTNEVAMHNYADHKMGSPGHDRRVDPGYFLPKQPTILKMDVMRGLPNLDKVGEVVARQRFAGLFETKWAKPLRESEAFKDIYVADFYPLPEWEDDCATIFPLGHQPAASQYLAVWRRFGEDVSTAHEWNRLNLRLSEYLQGKDIYLRRLEKGYNQPRWYGRYHD